MKLTFNQWVFLKIRPKILCKPCRNGIFLVPFDTVANGYNPSWQYALVNKDDKMYKMLFNNEDDIIDSLFKAKEIIYGNETYQNALFNKREEMQIQYDLENPDILW